MNGAWEGIVAPRIERGHIEALVSDGTAFVCVPSFLDPAWCAAVESRFFTLTEGPEHRYPYYRGMAIRSLALSLEMAATHEADYFARAAESHQRVRGVFEGGDDPLHLLHRQIADAGWKPVEALEGTHRYLSDLVWSLPPGTLSPLHADTYLLYVQRALSRFQHRLSYNVYLSTADEGGELVVYERRHERSDQAHRLGRNEPGMARRVVEGSRSASYHPRIGDLVVFDAYHYHEVTAISGARQRTTSHATIGVDPDAREIAFFV